MSNPPAGAAGGFVSRDARGTASTGWGCGPNKSGPFPFRRTRPMGRRTGVCAPGDQGRITHGQAYKPMAWPSVPTSCPFARILQSRARLAGHLGHVAWRAPHPGTDGGQRPSWPGSRSVRHRTGTVRPGPEFQRWRSPTRQRWRRSIMSWAASEGLIATGMPISPRICFFSAADSPPGPPSLTMAPAWPICLPGGASKPAM